MSTFVLSTLALKIKMKLEFLTCTYSCSPGIPKYAGEGGFACFCSTTAKCPEQRQLVEPQKGPRDKERREEQHVSGRYIGLLYKPPSPPFLPISSLPSRRLFLPLASNSSFLSPSLSYVFKAGNHRPYGVSSLDYFGGNFQTSFIKIYRNGRNIPKNCLYFRCSCT